jgi:aryl-alcohol dehydrogenase-like predicted oxidoreductase
VQFSLLDRRPLHGMLQYCQPRGIKLFTYGSVGGGLLSDKYVEQPKQGLFGEAAGQGGEGGGGQGRVPLQVTICNRRDKQCRVCLVVLYSLKVLLALC